MVDYMINYFLSFFQNPSAWGIGLAIAFGAVWLVCYRPPLFKKPWLWAVLASSAFFTLAAVCFVQIPLQTWAGQALGHFWSQEVLIRWILLAAIPQILLTLPPQFPQPFRGYGEQTGLTPLAPTEDHTAMQLSPGADAVGLAALAGHLVDIAFDQR